MGAFGPCLVAGFSFGKLVAGLITKRQVMKIFNGTSKIGQLFVLLLITSPFWGIPLYNYYQERQRCESDVIFQPATESVIGSSVWDKNKQGEAEHYVWFGSSRKFKTHAEAVQYCLEHGNE